MFKLKSVAVAVVSLAASVGAYATTTVIGPLPVPSTTSLNFVQDLVAVADGASFSDSFTFTTSVGATISVALFNDAVNFGVDSLISPTQGYEGGISSFAAKIDGTKVLTLSGPVAGNAGGYPALTLALGLNQTFQIGAGAHSISITGSTYSPGGSAYYGALTLTAATPVPEPETYAMMLAGLGAAALMARRRRNG